MEATKYKDSGIPWVGSVPEDWKLFQTSTLFHEHKEKNIGMKNSNLLSLSYGSIKKKDINTNEGLLPASFETYNVIEKGDIVFRLTDLQNDKRSLRTGLCKEDGIITSAYVTLRASQNLDPRFFHYLFHTYDICKVFYGMGDGVRQGMNYDDLRKLLLLFPPLPTQQCIADFLDRKCAEIDELAILQETMIEELKRYKQSLITETVTKGLNKNAKMKDSGVEWIGEIPERWEVKRLKNLFVFKTGSTPNNYDKVIDEEETVNWFTPSDIMEEGNSLRAAERRLLRSVIQNEKISLFPSGSLLFVGIGASAGKLGFTLVEGYSNQQITALIPFPQIESKYYFYYLIADRKRIRDNAFFTTLPIINNGYLSTIRVLVPSLSEQQQIADYLDRKCAEIDELIAIKQQKIEALKEYKKSVIFENVTGKKRGGRIKLIVIYSICSYDE